MSLVGFVAPLDDWKSSPKNLKNGLWLSMRNWLFGSARVSVKAGFWRLEPEFLGIEGCEVDQSNAKCHLFGDTTALFEHVTGLGFLFPPPRKT